MSKASGHSAPAITRRAPPVLQAQDSGRGAALGFEPVHGTPAPLEQSSFLKLQG